MFYGIRAHRLRLRCFTLLFDKKRDGNRKLSSVAFCLELVVNDGRPAVEGMMIDACSFCMLICDISQLVIVVFASDLLILTVSLLLSLLPIHPHDLRNPTSNFRPSPSPTNTNSEKVTY